jgi:hypothetical protein
VKWPKLTDPCRCGHPYATHLTGIGECGHFDVTFAEMSTDDQRAYVPNTIEGCDCEAFTSPEARP